MRTPPLFAAAIVTTVAGASSVAAWMPDTAVPNDARSEREPREPREPAGIASATPAAPAASVSALTDVPYATAYTNAILVHQELAEARRECLYNLVTVLGNAAADGLVVNGARGGLGTDAPMGKKLEGDSVYFQLLRIFSSFDFELGRQLRLETEGRCLPEHVSLGGGVFPRGYLAGFEQPFAGDVDKVKRALGLLAPDLEKFGVVQLPSAGFPVAWPGGVAYPPGHKDALLRAARAKLEYVRHATSPATDDNERLRAMAAAFEPLAITVDAQFPEGDEARGQLRVAAYLPPMRELDVPDVDRLKTWRMTTGVVRTALPREVDISLARLTHVQYLDAPDPSSLPIIRIELIKDFARPDRIETTVTFGELGRDAHDGALLPVSFEDPRNSLYVSLRPNLAVGDRDPGIVRSFKTAFNATANQYRVDARIHTLSLALERPRSRDPAAHDVDDAPLRPRFSLNGSNISFRVHRSTADAREQGRLRTVGFVCDPARAGAETDCHQDFGAYADVVSFVRDDAPTPGDIGGTLRGLYRKALTYAVGVNTKLVIDWNIRTIEDAIDAQFMEILADVMDRQDETRAKVRRRLERAVFE